jgi:uncharacterized membrane protein
VTVAKQENGNRGVAVLAGPTVAGAPYADKLLETVEAVIGPAIDTEKKRAEVAERVVQVVTSEFFGGPLPHPTLLRAYEDICPGLADRVVGVAEITLARRQNRLDEKMRYEYEDRRLRRHYALFGLLALLVAGIIALALGKVAIGTGLLGAAIIGTVIGTFVQGRRPHGTSGSEPTPASATSQSEAEAKSQESPMLWKRLMSLLPAR